MRLTDSTTKIALKSLLVATDFSPTSDVALKLAQSLATRYRSKITVVHAQVPSDTQWIPPENWGACQQAMDEATKLDLDRVSAELGAIPHRTVLRFGSVWDVISQAIDECKADLLIMGTHGRSGIERLVMGSTAEEIFRQATCPVLTIGPRVAKDIAMRGDFGEIVVPMDFSSESLVALPYAIALAEDYEARLTLVHVATDHIGPVTSSELLSLDRMKELREILPSDAPLLCTPEYVVKFGEPANCILEAAEEKGARLIVMGVKGAQKRLAAATHIATATAHTIVSLAHCPVLTVR